MALLAVSNFLQVAGIAEAVAPLTNITTKELIIVSARQFEFFVADIGAEACLMSCLSTDTNGCNSNTFPMGLIKRPSQIHMTVASMSNTQQQHHITEWT